MGHPRFTEDFKTDAVKQITERGHSVAKGSRVSACGSYYVAHYALRSGKPF